MPIYEYQCRKCEHRLEKLQKLSDAPLTECPECGASALVKLVSAAGFRLKGGGWYETDFKKNGKRNLAGDDSGKSDGKSDATKSDGKSDGKSESAKTDSTKTGSSKSSAETAKTGSKPAAKSANAAA